MALDLGPWQLPVRIAPASPGDLDRYLDLLEHVSNWLAERGIDQWRPGNFRAATAYYAGSITRGEVQLAFCGDALVGTLRLLLRDPVSRTAARSRLTSHHPSEDFASGDTKKLFLNCR